MIALLISSIVISVAYYAFYLIKHQFDRAWKETAAIRTFDEFSTALSNDVERGQWITDSLDSKQLSIGWNDSLIRYTIDTAWVVRETAWASDTFKLKTRVEKILYISDSLPLIRAVTFVAEIDKVQVPLLKEKRYSTKELMDAEKLFRHE